MPARRIIAVSPDPAFGDQLATALQVAGEVALYRSVGSLGEGDLSAALCVLHVDGEIAPSVRPILDRLTGPCRAIIVLPHASLAPIVDIMHTSDRVAGVLFVESFRADALIAMVDRLASGDLFGLDKRMAPGTQIHTEVIGDYLQKSQCLARITALVTEAKIRRAFHASVEQCSDEMMMNALYDAPVDDQRKPIFAGVPTKTRILLRTEQTVTVQYAYDGRRFAVCARDAFGSLERQTVLRMLYKCLHAQHQVDRKAGGAGVGLYLMASAATTVDFNVVPGVATEVACTFEIAAPKPRLEEFGFFEERSDITGKLVAGRAATRPAMPGARRGQLAMILGAAIVALVLVGVGLWPRLFGGKRTATTRIATIDLDSEPTGATVVIDGKSVGGTPLTLTNFAPNTDVTIVLKRIGYRDSMVQLKVPGPGEKTHLLEPLHISDDFVRVHFVSTPSGAQVVRIGQAAADADRTYTPADVFVAANQVQRFVLTMPGHVPLAIDPFTPARGAGVIEKGGALAPGATLHVEAAQPGTVTVVGAVQCTDVAPPVDCTLASGTYSVEYTATGQPKITRTVTVADTDTTIKL